jgi:hypothetical protein
MHVFLVRDKIYGEICERVEVSTIKYQTFYTTQNEISPFYIKLLI